LDATARLPHPTCANQSGLSKQIFVLTGRLARRAITACNAALDRREPGSPESRSLVSENLELKIYQRAEPQAKVSAVSLMSSMNQPL
jgi:hypothetical protein